MVLDRAWMYGGRTSPEFSQGVVEFLDRASQHMLESNEPKMFCPCVICKNEVLWPRRQTIEEHIILRGFMESYTCWSKHGEQQPAIFADNRDDLSNDNHEVNARDGLGNADDDVHPDETRADGPQKT